VHDLAVASGQEATQIMTSKRMTSKTGAAGNVIHGGNVNTSCNRKGGMVTPHLKRGATVFYPNNMDQQTWAEDRVVKTGQNELDRAREAMCASTPNIQGRNRVR
jgi:hypothetical protein